MIGSRRALLLPLLALAACGIDKADIGMDTPPLLQREEGTSPADSTANLYDADGLDLVVNFNRAFEAGEITLAQIVPRPAELGPIDNPSTNPKQVVFHRAVLETAFPAYHLVFDGPSMPAPVLLTYFSGTPSAFDGGIQGHVFISRGITSPGDALVYALVPIGREAEFELSGNEETLFGRPVLGVTKTLLIPTEEGGWFALGGLEVYRRYLVLAMLDTSRDGVYDREVDWWGFYAEPGGVPIEVMAGVTLGGFLEPPLPEKPTNIDFWMFAPGTLDPLLD